MRSSSPSCLFIISSARYFSAFDVIQLIRVMAPFISLRDCCKGFPTSEVNTPARCSMLLASNLLNRSMVSILSVNVTLLQAGCACLKALNLTAMVSEVSASISRRICSEAGLIICIIISVLFPVLPVKNVLKWRLPVGFAGRSSSPDATVRKA